MRGARDRIAWAFTGAGHFLAESVAVAEEAVKLVGIDAYASRAALEVLSAYAFITRLEASCGKITEETGYSFPVSGRFSRGVYRAFVIAPATSNTVSKCALGISDSLVSCLFAQAGKSRVPVCILPTDTSDLALSTAPDGSEVAVYPRKIDLLHVRRLARMEGVVLVDTPGALFSWLKESFS